MRLVNLIVAAALVLAAAYVYKIKVAATVEAERVAKLRMEISRERDVIAALRAETARLENPERVQRLADRYLPLKLLDPVQIDTIDSIPLRTTDVVVPEITTAAPAQPKAAPAEVVTGSVRPPARAR
ncbi:MAG: cell division protein FtsL [Rhodoplanes sp.]